MPGIDFFATPTTAGVRRCNPSLTLFGALILSSAACVPAPAAGTCFVDAHCGPDLACVDGFCGMPVGSSSSDDGLTLGGDDLKLDAGGASAEIPSTCTAAASVRTNAGCEFWAVDLPNVWFPSQPFSLDIAAEQQFAVVVANVSTSEVANVEVFEGDSSSPLLSVTVDPLDAATLELPDRSIDPTKNSKGVGFRIKSDVPITAYQFQPLDNLVPVYSNDASALLPAHVLENDYIAVTSDASTFTVYDTNSWEESSASIGAFVTAVATDDDTHVVFYPTTGLAPGNIEDIVIDRGETFTILSDSATTTGDPWGNLSGTRVIADRPIALFSGNIGAGEPRGSDKCCADHVEHQMLPLVAWGASYIAVPPSLPGSIVTDVPAVYRVTAAFDGTSFAYAGAAPEGAPTTLDANETAMFSTDEPLLIRSDADHPFAVTQYFLSSRANPGGGDAGDPAMIAQPSLSQLQTRYVFLTPSGYSESIVAVYARQGSNVTIDGQEVDGWRELGEIDGSTWAFARVRVQPGAHVLISDEHAGIDVYGYDDFVSYAYAGGSAVERISEAPPIP